MPAKTLKSDGYYNSEYNTICAYSDRGVRLKHEFLKDAASVLRAAGKLMTSYPLQKIYTNPSGIAGSGDVALYAYNDAGQGVYITASQSFVSTGRQDGVSFMARWSFASGKMYKTIRSEKYNGPNQWISAAFNSDELAEKLVQIAGTCPSSPGSSQLEGNAMHTRSAVLPLPSLLLEKAEDGLPTMQAHQAAEAAMVADNKAPLIPEGESR